MQTVKHAQSMGRPLMSHDAPPPPPLVPDPSGRIERPSSWTTPSNEPASGQVPTTAGDVLDVLVESLRSTRGAVLASVDGFPLAKSSNMASEPSHAAMLAAAMGIARQLVAMGDGTTLRQLVVDHDGGLLLIWPIGSQRVLAVLADSTVDQRALRAFVQTYVRILADRPSRAAS
jgi:predicted regulator of Ras-like GTPase activity (Roadblock/LC7/MglB family)